MCDDRYGLFPGDNVRLVAERTMAEVLEETATFLRSAHRDETLLLYYSGHGRLDLSNELYLCMHNSRVDLLRATAVKASDLRAMIDDSAAATTIVILDCCHSGAFKGGSFAERLTGKGCFVITSCRTGDLANDSHALNHASMFTHHLVRGMLGGATDHNDDGLVNLDELYHYVHYRLTEESRQIPERSFAGSGDVPIARQTSITTSTTVVDPSDAEPILDVSPTEIKLEEVGPDEELPPELVSVINRGGGQLTWSVECRAVWVALEVDENDLLLRLRPPRPGTNRANVTIRDNRTGLTKTVRVIVRVVSPAAPALDKPERRNTNIDPRRGGPDTPNVTGAPERPDRNPGRPRTEPTWNTKPRRAASQPTTRDARPAWLRDAATSMSSSIDRMASKGREQGLAGGWRWKLRHSLWLLAIVLSLGFGTSAAFFYIGLHTKRRSWIWAAAAYGMATIVLIALISTLPKDTAGEVDSTSWQNNAGAAIMLVLWLGGIVHGLIVNRDWLRWQASRRRPLPPTPPPPPPPPTV